MQSHEVAVEFVIRMDEMDGDPHESAEVFLDVYSNDARKAVEDLVGSPITHWEVTDAWEAEVPDYSFMQQVREVVPFAQFETDNEGQLVVYTGMTVNDSGNVVPLVEED